MGIAAEGWRSSAIINAKRTGVVGAGKRITALKTGGCLGMVLTNQQRMVRGSMRGQALSPRKSKRDPPR